MLGFKSTIAHLHIIFSHTIKDFLTRGVLMRITSFSHGDNLLGWEFQEVNLKNLSLFVGESASGKSLMLTSLFRIATKVVSDQQPFVGHWKFRFEIAGIAYEWE